MKNLRLIGWILVIVFVFVSGQASAGDRSLWTVPIATDEDWDTIKYRELDGQWPVEFVCEKGGVRVVVYHYGSFKPFMTFEDPRFSSTGAVADFDGDNEREILIYLRDGVYEGFCFYNIDSGMVDMTYAPNPGQYLSFEIGYMDDFDQDHTPDIVIECWCYRISSFPKACHGKPCCYIVFSLD